MVTILCQFHFHLNFLKTFKEKKKKLGQLLEDAISRTGF